MGLLYVADVYTSALIRTCSRPIHSSLPQDTMLKQFHRYLFDALTSTYIALQAGLLGVFFQQAILLILHFVTHLRCATLSSLTAFQYIQVPYVDRHVALRCTSLSHGTDHFLFCHAQFIVMD